MIFLDNSTSTSKTDFQYLAPGTWKFHADIPGTDAAAVTIQQRQKGSSIDDDVNSISGVVSLTYNDAASLVTSAGEEFAVTRTGGGVSTAITVVANRVPN